MRHTRLVAVAAVVLAMVVGVSGVTLLRAQPQPVQPEGRWQYGILTLGAGEPVFVTGKQEFRAAPPTGRGGGGGSSPGRYADRANLIGRDVWNNDVLTLDALGADGWEAVSMSQTDGPRTTVLMRRRY
jgi:hypothetical protein